MIASTPSLAQRYAALAGLPEHLRSTHLGINDAIDRVVEAVRPWYLLADAQTRPRVVGLWGMTGTGKSSLVRSLVAYLGLQDRTFWLDAGEHGRHDWLDGVLDRMRENHQNSPFVLVVDEFQHARTVKGGIEHDEPPELRRLWELIDSGRAIVQPGYRHGLRALIDLEDQFQTMLRLGVTIKHGKVTGGQDIYRKVMAAHGVNGSATPLWALPENVWDHLRDQFTQPISLLEFQRQLEQLDGEGVHALLRALVTSCINPEPVDGSKALILVLGNLDELYSSGRVPLPELDPEVLLSRHRDLSTTSIQQSLMGMFRVEQVARMGTDHVVFPPMGRSAVEATVAAETEVITSRLSEHGGLRLRTTKALRDRIQRTSTIAVLGARPVVAAVHRILPALYAQVLTRSAPGTYDHCMMDNVDGQVVAYLKSGGNTEVLSLHWPVPPQKGPEQHPEDVRHYAVHEAGHVVCGVRLRGLKALQACARTSSERIGGFVIWAHPSRVVVTRAQVVPQLACMLGGWAAERLVYGADGVSTGCHDDLQNAAQLALDLVKEHGFGDDRLFRTEHPSAPTSGFRTMLAGAEEQARLWLEEAEALAIRTLEAEHTTLQALTDALAEEGSLGASAILAFLAADPHLVLENRV